ncbi:MAG: PilZ domain-containing protein [Erythrobacter sp.]
MTGMETRSLPRDSLFLLATVRIEQKPELYRVRVRNLSDGGMMAEGNNVPVQRGHRVCVELRNIGEVMGSVAWVQDNRFGISFEVEINSQRARRPLCSEPDPALGVIERSWAHRAPPPPNIEAFRKI